MTTEEIIICIFCLVNPAATTSPKLTPRFSLAIEYDLPLAGCALMTYE